MQFAQGPATSRPVGVSTFQARSPCHNDAPIVRVENLAGLVVPAQLIHPEPLDSICNASEAVQGLWLGVLGDC